jgi:hypothetical protein
MNAHDFNRAVAEAHALSKQLNDTMRATADLLRGEAVVTLEPESGFDQFAVTIKGVHGSARFVLSPEEWGSLTETLLTIAKDRTRNLFRESGRSAEQAARVFGEMPKPE